MIRFFERMNERMKKNKKVEKILDINHMLFQQLLVAFLILLLIEQLWAKSVSRYLDMNIFLLIVIISGVFAVLNEKSVKEEKISKKKTYLISGAAGAATLVILFYKLGSLSFGPVVSVIGALLVALLSYLVLSDDEGGNES